MVLAVARCKTLALDVPRAQTKHPKDNKTGEDPMDFDTMFSAQLSALKDEGNYRIFAELERQCGAVSEGQEP